MLIALALTLALAFAGFTSLALSMDRHQRDFFRRRLDGTRSRRLRHMGWVLLAGSAVPCIAGEGWGMGLVIWLGALTPAAGGVLGGLTATSPAAIDRTAQRKGTPHKRERAGIRAEP